MRILTHIRRPRASTVIASLALFVALGGTATAASLITGAKIKNGTITGADLKNSTLTGAKVKNGSLATADLSAASLSSLRGAKGDAGAAGPAGPAGPAGAAGAQGPRGVVSPKAQTLGSKIIPDGQANTTILSNAIAAGTYVVTAKATLDAEDNDRVTCSLFNAAQSIDQTQWDAPSAAVVSGPMSLSAVVTIAGGPLSLQCATDGTADAQAKDVKMIAVPVG